MSTLSRRRAEPALTIALVLLFAAPLFLMILRASARKTRISDWLDHHWMGHHALIGETAPTPKVRLSWTSVRSGEFQKSQTVRFNETFAGREAFIRWTNELWFRLFREPGNVSSQVVIGEHDNLFERGYLEEYFLARTDKSALEPWVKSLRRLQDFCRSIDMGFAVVLAPSKASIYSEDIPKRWRRWYDPRPRAQVLLRELFRENEIVFVDGVELVEQQKAKTPPAPLFPKGGIHWNERAALIVANAVHERFVGQNIRATDIEPAKSTITLNPSVEEGDLMRLMNLAHPWQYAVERITLKSDPRPRPQQLTMTMVGDSFSWTLLNALSQSGQYSDINYYFYYSQWKTHFSGGDKKKVRQPSGPLDFRSEVFAADCLLLEINEATGAGPEHHLSAFIKDALAHLPDRNAPRAAFRTD